MSFALLFAALLAICAARPDPQNGAVPKGDEDLYTSRFDDVNLDEVLASDRLLGNYFRCLMERGPCTPDAAELRRKYKIRRIYVVSSKLIICNYRSRCL